MRNFNTVFTLLLISALVFFGYQAFFKPKVIKTVENTSQALTNKKVKTPNKPVEAIIEKNTLPDSKTNKYTFSADPLVESAMISAKFMNCQQYFYFHNNANMSFKDYFKTDIQMNYFLKASENCEEIDKKHPEYGLNSLSVNYQKRATRKANSLLGRAMEYDQEPLSGKEIMELYAVLGNDYPELINYPFPNTLKYEFAVLYPNLKDIIQTSNLQYIAYIVYHSKNYLACELGVNCSSSGLIMQGYCRSEVNFCVADFEQLFANRLSEGMKADILLALPYFRKLYKVTL